MGNFGDKMKEYERIEVGKICMQIRKYCFSNSLVQPGQSSVIKVKRKR
jgi:hypothetical protein